MLLGLYALGFVTANYNFGRVVFFVVFLPQLEIARFVGRVEAVVRASGPPIAGRLVAAVTVVTCLVLSERSLVSATWDTLRAPRAADGYEFLTRDVGQYDVMMADLRTGWIAASFGGKLVSAQHPLAFVSEEEQGTRRADVRTFFRAAASQTARRRCCESAACRTCSHHAELRPTVRSSRRPHCGPWETSHTRTIASCSCAWTRARATSRAGGSGHAAALVRLRALRRAG